MEGMFLLPPAAGKCQECACEHTADQPHNAQSLYYQTKFQMDHGRGANWKDAMEHCDEATRKKWTEALIDLGVDVEGGKVNPE